MRQRDAPSRDAPLALWSRIHGAERLVAVNAAAEARRLKPGMAVANSRAMCPSARLEEHDPQADRATLEKIADWCSRFTPLAALDAPNGVMLDVTGAAELFGGEAKLLDEIEARLGAQGFHARAALAGGPALSRAMARFSRLRLVPPGLAPGEIEALAAPLPVAALGLEEPAGTRLARAGLVRIGDLLARPRAPLAARLGAAAMARLDALVCREREPIVPRFPAPSHIAERRFPEGLTRLADIEATLRLLCEDLRPLLERSGLGARRLEAAFYRVDGAVKRLVIGTSRPLRDPVRLFGLLRERLDRLAEEGLDTGYGFDVLRLAAIATERLDDEQGSLNETNLAKTVEAEDLADLVDHIGARLGTNRVLRLDPLERHWPECSVRAAPAASPAPGARAETPKFAPLDHVAFRRNCLNAENVIDLKRGSALYAKNRLPLFRCALQFGPCASLSGPSRSRRSRSRPTGRRCDSAGAARCTKPRLSKDPNASRRPGGRRRKIR